MLFVYARVVVAASQCAASGIDIGCCARGRGHFCPAFLRFPYGAV
jgi:hypothetical protein